MIQHRPRLTKEEYELILERRKGLHDNNVLVIGDLHAPFTLKRYLDHCVSIREKYNCREIVFIGDCIDNHYSSYHETDPDGHSAARELELAKAQIAEFYDAFPEAKVCIGNHDLIPNRKSFSAGLSKTWLRPIGEVLETPNWEYAEDFIIDGVLYTHGTGRKARQRAQQEFISVVQGHYHSDSYIEYYASPSNLLFAMQVGCGIDDKAYAFAYGRHFRKSHINVGVVMDGGRYAIIEPMNLFK